MSSKNWQNDVIHLSEWEFVECHWKQLLQQESWNTKWTIIFDGGRLCSSNSVQVVIQMFLQVSEKDRPPAVILTNGHVGAMRIESGLDMSTVLDVPVTKAFVADQTQSSLTASAIINAMNNTPYGHVLVYLPSKCCSSPEYCTCTHASNRPKSHSGSRGNFERTASPCSWTFCICSCSDAQKTEIVRLHPINMDKIIKSKGRLCILVDPHSTTFAGNIMENFCAIIVTDWEGE